MMYQDIWLDMTINVIMTKTYERAITTNIIPDNKNAVSRFKFMVNSFPYGIYICSGADPVHPSHCYDPKHI